MSSIASFYRVSRADLAELDSAGGLAELLDGATDLGDEYGWSGNVMLNLLTTLEENGINLGTDVADEVDQGDETGVLFFATAADLETIEGLDLNQIDEEALRDDLELDDDELREAIAESVTTLHQLVAGTGPDEVLIISIG